MKTQEEKKEFALAQIAPYFKDNSLCGYDKENRICMYLTQNGNMCVVGKNMNEKALKKYKDSSKAIWNILATNNQEQVFKPESVNIFSFQEWSKLQRIHDYIAKKNHDSVRIVIISLGLFTYDELVEYAKKL
jgi:hypothetical protein